MVESSGLHDTAHPRVSVHVSQNQVLRLVGVDNDATNHGWLSDKERFGFQYLGSEHRLTSPLIRRHNELVEVGWAEALHHVAERIAMVRDSDGGEAFAVIGGAHGSNEDAYALSKFARVVLGTNNVDSCARVCHAPSSTALKRSLGAGLSTNSFDDIEVAHTILVCGANPTEDHPIVGARIKQQVLRGRANLIVVDPRATELARLATVHLALRPGTNIPLLNALGHCDS
jgi:formate dehydrogenase major subunit